MTQENRQGNLTLPMSQRGYGSQTLPMSGAGRRATIKFLLDFWCYFDVTGSMGDKMAVFVASVMKFADLLAKTGHDTLMALVAFRDLFEGENHSIYNFSTPEVFKKNLAKQIATGGGGNLGESCLSAIVNGLGLSYRNDSNKRVGLIVTDEPCHNPDADGTTIKQVIDGLLAAKITAYVIAPPTCKEYLTIANVTGGVFYDITAAGNDTKFHDMIDTMFKTVSASGTRPLVDSALSKTVADLLKRK